MAVRTSSRVKIMNAEPIQHRHGRLDDFQRKHRTGLVPLVFTDLVNSVALRRQLGDQAGTSLLQPHP